MSILEHMTFWQWWVLAFGLLGIQILRPGAAYYIWMSVGAGIAGLVLLLAPKLAWEWQAILFSAFSLSAIGVWQIYVKRHPLFASEHFIRNSAEKLLDRIFTLNEPINNGLGKLQVENNTYTIEGDDMPRGSQVRVVGFDDTALLVSRV